ncbi:hypothetical protein CGSHiII_02025 [Haemophilus influenzae PittII]|nr:hypothetical protein CGSHiII_02025 [Haemophilus influenzae PittII]
MKNFILNLFCEVRKKSGV